MSLRKQNRPGFTLFQLLLIMAVLLILLALLLPALVEVPDGRGPARGSNNLKQLILATQNNADTYEGKLPPSIGTFPNNGPNAAKGTVHFFLLPYLEQQQVYVMANDGKRLRVSHDGTAAVVIQTFLAPNDPSAPPDHLYEGWLALCNYPLNYLVFQTGGNRLATITDGLSQTIFFAERYRTVQWPSERLGLRRLVLLDADVRLLQHRVVSGLPAAQGLRSREGAIAVAGGNTGWYGRRQRASRVAEAQAHKPGFTPANRTMANRWVWIGERRSEHRIDHHLSPFGGLL